MTLVGTRYFHPTFFFTTNQNFSKSSHISIQDKQLHMTIITVTFFINICRALSFLNRGHVKKVYCFNFCTNLIYNGTGHEWITWFMKGSLCWLLSLFLSCDRHRTWYTWINRPELVSVIVRMMMTFVTMNRVWAMTYMISCRFVCIYPCVLV